MYTLHGKSNHFCPIQRLIAYVGPKRSSLRTTLQVTTTSRTERWRRHTYRSSRSYTRASSGRCPIIPGQYLSLRPFRHPPTYLLPLRVRQHITLSRKGGTRTSTTIGESYTNPSWTHDTDPFRIGLKQPIKSLMSAVPPSRAMIPLKMLNSSGRRRWRRV